LRGWFFAFAFVAFGLFASLPTRTFAADTLNWQTNQNRVSADIKSSELLQVLETIAGKTGWKVFVEPETLHTVSVKFKDLPPGEALHLLLGDVNFALLPGTNSSHRLYVFRTTMQRATQQVNPRTAEAKATAPKTVPNELIVRLKPGMKIDELAKLLGAKVIGHIDLLNAYRLQFDDQAASDAARQQLASNPDVGSVEDNFTINQPEMAQGINGNVPPPKLQLDPPPANGRTVLGLIDTAVQPLGDGLDQFVLKQISVAGDSPTDGNTPLHGTSMAETMLRTLQLLSDGHSSINIQPYDIYGAGATANTWNLATAIAQAVNSGANPISMSLGSSSDSSLVRDLIKDGSGKGIAFFAAVGNDGGPQMDFPAADSGAIPVTALNRDGTVASYANNSGNSAIGALGTVVVTFNGQTWVVSGTSPATAIASSTAANLMVNSGMTGPVAAASLAKNPTQTTVPHK
jgi:thermitase